MNDQPQSQQLSRAERIESAIDKQTTGALAINRHGQVNFVNANEIMEFAKIMALAKQAIPPHLRDNPGGCMAVCIQASSWQMSPFAVANKSYVVNDRMAYEAQIIAAVILMRAPIKGRLKYTYTGSEGTRRCTCTAILDDGETVDYQTPEIRNIKIQNSPLWKNDPDQQLAYSAARSLARRHFPDVILGVYTPEEMAEETTIRDVTPIPGRPAIGNDTTTNTPPEPDPKNAQMHQPEGKPQPEQRPQKPAPKKEPPAPSEPVVQEQPPAQEEQPAKEITEEDRKKLVDEVNEMRDAENIPMVEFRRRIAGLGWAGPSDLVNKYPAVTLLEIKANWQQVLDFGKQPAAEESAK